MQNLSRFKQKILIVLEKLQYLCDIATLYKHNTKKGIEYFFSDFFPPVVGQEELRDVIQYLNKNGLEILITFPIDDSDPREPQYQKEYGDAENVPLGLIKGKNIEEIKQVIQKNINKLKGQNDVVKEVKEKKINTSPKVVLSQDKIIWVNKSFVVRRGQKKMMGLFLKSSREFRKNTLTKNGEPINRKVLQNQGGYKDEQSWRNSLNKLRAKVKKSGMPIEIINETNNYYILEIRYS